MPSKAKRPYVVRYPFSVRSLEELLNYTFLVQLNLGQRLVGEEDCYGFDGNICI
jgi:hypothetical protein